MRSTKCTIALLVILLGSSLNLSSPFSQPQAPSLTSPRRQATLCRDSVVVVKQGLPQLHAACGQVFCYQRQHVSASTRPNLITRSVSHSILSMSADPSLEAPPNIINSNPPPQNTSKVQIQLAISNFITTLKSSLYDDTFISFTLKGPSAPRGNKNAKAARQEESARLKEGLRGKFKSIQGRLVLLNHKKKKKSFNKEADENAGSLYLQANIKYHLATDKAQNWKVDTADSASDEVEIGLRALFAIAMGTPHQERDTNANLLSEWGVTQIEGDELGILNGELVTSRGIYKLSLQPPHKAGFALTKQQPKGVKIDEDAATPPVALAHDKQKNVPLPTTSPFFQKLGVTNADGKPVNGMASKLRQCQKFVEIVGKLVGDAVGTSSSQSSTAVRVIDQGCGKGYLTFSLHSYLCDKYLSVDSNIGSVQTQGIDRRPKLIQEINGIARDLGGEFDSLNFIEGTIGSTENDLFNEKELHQNDDSSNEDSKSSTLDILIALHACDTATDDAIWFAIARNADIIVTAPCCQHELRPQIDAHASLLAKLDSSNPLNEILRHAIYRERHTEIVTDAMRAILLEIAGYETNIFEFVGGEHTAKNVMITAVKQERNSQERDGNQLRHRRTKLADLAEMYGVKRQRLAALMGESIGTEEVKNGVKTASGMPPL